MAIRFKWVATLLCASACLATHAADTSDGSGFYAGLGAGGSTFGTPGTVADKVKVAERDRAVKLYGGYQFNESLGIQAGWVNLGKLNDSFVLNGQTVTQSARGQSLYVAGTARMVIDNALSLTAKAGVSAGRLQGSSTLDAANAVIGSKTSFMWGVGEEYRVSKNVALMLEFEKFGKLSNHGEAKLISFGTRVTF